MAPTTKLSGVRASAGVLLCGVPLLLIEVNHWLALVLAAGLLLFALFLVRTALRHHTRYLLGDAADSAVHSPLFGSG